MMSTRAMSLLPIIEILAVQMGGVCCAAQRAIIEEILAVWRASNASSLLIFFHLPSIYRDKGHHCSSIVFSSLQLERTRRKTIPPSTTYSHGISPQIRKRPFQPLL
jgi:hypothetical protein